MHSDEAPTLSSNAEESDNVDSGSLPSESPIAADAGVLHDTKSGAQADKPAEPKDKGDTPTSDDQASVKITIAEDVSSTVVINEPSGHGDVDTADGSSASSEESTDPVLLSNDGGLADGDGIVGSGEILTVPSDRKLDFIDDELAMALAVYGKKYGDANRKVVFLACLFGGIVLGFLPPFLGINIWPFFLTAVALSTAYATIVGYQVMDAYARHDYRTTSRRLSHALWWNAFCAPFTYFTFYACSQIQSRLLLLQGRYTELEALLLISRAANERRVVGDAIPKHAVIANDLACTYIAQHRYLEATDLLKHVLSGKSGETVKQYARLNLALCYVKTDQIEESSKIIQENEKSFSKAPETLRLRVAIVQGMIDLKTKRFEEAELKLDEAIARARKFKESDELLAICFLTLGELRWRQDRIEEADLYYRTGIDLFKVNTEPSYWSLAAGLRDYAEMLDKTGQVDESAKRLREAELYESAFLEREMMRLTYLRYKVTQEKPVRMLTDLVNVDGFPPLSVELNPPDQDGFAHQPEVNLDQVEIEARKLEALESMESESK